MNDLVFISDVIYGLKTEYGESITVNRDSTISDYASGEQTKSTSSTIIGLAIPMPETLRQQFSRLSGVKREGYLNPGDQEFLIDKSDVPNLDVKVNDYVLHNGKRKDVTRVEDFEYAWIITTRIV